MENFKNNNELKQFLLSIGFNNDGGEDDFEYYSNSPLSISICIYEQEKRDMDWGHSEDGYYSLKNCSFDDIKLLLSFIKKSKFIQLNDIPNEKFKSSVLGILQEFIDDRETKN